MKKKILVVDDSPPMRKEILQIVNSMKKFDIVGECENGEECLSLYNVYKPEIIILDLEMPVKDGLETLIELKKLNKYVKVLITAIRGQNELILQALSAGANEYIMKPVNAKKLVSILNTMSARGYY